MPCTTRSGSTWIEREEEWEWPDWECVFHIEDMLFLFYLMQVGIGVVDAWFANSVLAVGRVSVEITARAVHLR